MPVIIFAEVGHKLNSAAADIYYDSLPTVDLNGFIIVNYILLQTGCSY